MRSTGISWPFLLLAMLVLVEVVVMVVVMVMVVMVVVMVVVVMVVVMVVMVVMVVVRFKCRMCAMVLVLVQVALMTGRLDQPPRQPNTLITTYLGKFYNSSIHPRFKWSVSQSGGQVLV